MKYNACWYIFVNIYSNIKSIPFFSYNSRISTPLIRNERCMIRLHLLFYVNFACDALISSIILCAIKRNVLTSVNCTLQQPTPRLSLPTDSVSPLNIVFNNFYGLFACRTEEHTDTQKQEQTRTRTGSHQSAAGNPNQFKPQL